MATSDMDDGCRLLQLPAELRIHIYCLAFTYDKSLHPDEPKQYIQRTALLRTSRQVRVEACKLFFAETHFAVIRWTSAVDLGKFTSWLSSITREQAQLISKVPLMFGGAKPHDHTFSTWMDNIYEHQHLGSLAVESLLSAGVRKEVIDVEEYRPEGNVNVSYWQEKAEKEAVKALSGV